VTVEAREEWESHCQKSAQSNDREDSAPATAAVRILSCEDVCVEYARHLIETSAIAGSRDVLTSEGSWQKFLAHAPQSRLIVPAGLFVSKRIGSHSAGISCTTHELFIS
jgi:hypothetical protein